MSNDAKNGSAAEVELTEGDVTMISEKAAPVPSRGDRVEIVDAQKQFTADRELFATLLKKHNIATDAWAMGVENRCKGNVLLVSRHPKSAINRTVVIVSLDNSRGLIAMAPHGLSTLATAGMRVKLRPSSSPLYVEMHDAARRMFPEFKDSIAQAPQDLGKIDVTVRFIRTVPNTEKFVDQFAFLVEDDRGQRAAVHGTELVAIRKGATKTGRADDDADDATAAAKKRPRVEQQQEPLEMVAESTPQQSFLKRLEEYATVQRSNGDNGEGLRDKSAGITVLPPILLTPGGLLPNPFRAGSGIEPQSNQTDAAISSPTTRAGTGSAGAAPTTLEGPVSFAKANIFFALKPNVIATAFGAQRFERELVKDAAFLRNALCTIPRFPSEPESLYGSQMYRLNKAVDFL